MCKQIGIISITPERFVSYLNEKKCTHHNFTGKGADISASKTSVYLQTCCCGEFAFYLVRLFWAVRYNNITEEDLNASTMDNPLIQEDVNLLIK